MRRWRSVVLAGLLVGLGVAVAIPLPEPVDLPPTGVDILDRHGRLLYEVVDPVRGAARPVPLANMTPALRLATIAVEDGSFASNPGIDPLADLRALRQNLAAGHVVAGGSTITQQLARLRYLPAEMRSSQSVGRKLWESWLALRLTARLGKDQVLEDYLNSAPYGNLAVGVEAAAWTYFAKPASELSIAEAALLAGLPQSPTDYDPFTHLPAARERQQVVLNLMQRHGMLTAAEVSAAAAEPLVLNDRPFPLNAAHFVDYIRTIAPPGATTRIRTTLDRDLQARAERAAQRHVGRLADHNVSDAAVVVLDPQTGEVLAMVGGVDYFAADQPAAQVNLAVAARQPGSAFKPITYAAALESGRFSEASILRDERTVFRTRDGEIYVPLDYDHQFHGPVALRVALGSSLNVPAVEVEAATGLDTVAALGDDLGLHLGDPGRLDLSLTLGGAEVRLLDLTAAYGAFATGGVFHPAIVISQPVTPGRRVVSPETAWLIDDMLSDDAARGPGFGRDGVLHVPGHTVAVKTGTTSDFRDNWTIGFTPDVVVGVWVGNADNRAMRDVSGVTGAAPLWRDVLETMLADVPEHAFDRPAELVQVELCASSDEVASGACPAHRLEWLPATLAPIRAPIPRSTLRIAFPDPDTVIELDPDLPPAAQQLAIAVASSLPVSRIDVLVDGHLVGTLARPGPFAWLPTPGHHILQAIADGLASEPVPIEVLPPRP